MTQPAGHDDMFPADTLRTDPGDSVCIVSTELPISDSGDDEAILMDAIQRAVGDQNFQHWFHKRTRAAVSGDRLTVYVPNPFVLNWILRRFRSDLNRAAQLLLGPSGSCQLEVDSTLINSADSKSGSPSGTTGTQGSQSVSPTNGSQAPSGSQAVSSNSASSNSAARMPLPGPSGDVPSGRRRFRSFQSYVVGECNQLAAMAARQVAASPAQKFNPLYIFGGTGTGKTHLLEAIYTEVRRQNANANVMYLTSEAFTNYFTSALSSRTVPSFRQRFRNVHVLLIDNIEFLDNKRATQEEFLHTIVQVIEHGGQVVVTSDRHPRMLTRHREELTTRFMSGLVCRVENPDEDMCSKLVRSLAISLTATFTEEVLDYVARRCRKNVREIQGALNSLDGYFQLTRKRITLTVAREVLGDLTQECRKLVRIADVERIVCEAFDVKASDLRSKSRRKAISVPRSVAMFVARKLTNSAYREIGQYFGGRDHSTVVAAEKRIALSIESNERLDVPTSCSAKTIADIIDYVESRLLSA
ncbi:MAG: chromosomal replication initiator protein DnaA [Planctomyces sp.]|nr:chromosomal replication initiator protein DnaA [Planctomyces sp.]